MYFPKNGIACNGKKPRFLLISPDGVSSVVAGSPETREIYSMLDQCLASVYNAGPTLIQHCVDVSCLLGWVSLMWYWVLIDDIDSGFYISKMASAGYNLTNGSQSPHRLREVMRKLLLCPQLCPRRILGLIASDRLIPILMLLKRGNIIAIKRLQLLFIYFCCRPDLLHSDNRLCIVAY